MVTSDVKRWSRLTDRIAAFTAGRHLERRPRRPHHERRGLHALLRQRDVGLLPGRRLGSEVADVADHAHDDPLLVGDRDPLAQRVLPGPVLAGRRVVDEHHERRRRPIEGRQVAAAQQRHPQHLQVVGRDPAHVDRRCRRPTVRRGRAVRRWNDSSCRSAAGRPPRRRPASRRARDQRRRPPVRSPALPCPAARDAGDRGSAGAPTASAITPLGSNPESTRIRLTKLRAKSPAPTRSSMVRATSTTTSPLRRRRPPVPGVVERPPAASGARAPWRVARRPGIRPQARPMATAAPEGDRRRPASR